jgi:hypothetical protein
LYCQNWPCCTSGGGKQPLPSTIWQYYALEEGSVETWPTLDDLPNELHPDTIEAKDYCGKIPEKGAFKLHTNGIPQSYAADPNAADDRKVALKSMFVSPMLIMTLDNWISMYWSQRNCLFGTVFTTKQR